MASDLIERLKKCALGSADEDVMVRWDKIRAILKQDKGGTWPRECFESIIDGYAEDCEDAVKEIESLRSSLAIERERADKAEKERDEIRQYCSAAYHDYTDLLRLLATEEGHPFEELFKATAAECRETSEFLRLASEGKQNVAAWENELTKAKSSASAAEASLAEAKRLLKVFADWCEKLESQFADHDDSVIAGGLDWAPVTFGDLRAAARFLAQAPTEEPQR